MIASKKLFLVLGLICLTAVSVSGKGNCPGERDEAKNVEISNVTEKATGNGNGAREESAGDASGSAEQVTDTVLLAKNSGSAASLKMEKIEVKKVDYHNYLAEISILFNEPVSISSLERELSLELNGEKVDPVDIIEASGGKEVVITVGLPRRQINNRLNLTLDSGVKDRKGRYRTDQDVKRQLNLGSPPRIEFYSVSVREGTNGYYLYVDCDDYSEEYSGMCNIDPELLKEKISITPEVNPTIAPEAYGFRVFGRFRQGSYTFTAEAGLSSSSGGKLWKEYSMKFTIPRRTPKAFFGSKGRYLPRQRLKSVPVRHINLEELSVTVRKIPEKNLVFWLSGEQEKADDRTSDVIGQKKFKVSGKEDSETLSWIDLSDLVPAEAKGVFEFRLGSGGSDAIRLILTDLTLVAKRYGENQRDLSIWVLDSERLSPVSNAKVELLSTSNRILAGAMTDSGGRVHFENITDPLAGSDKAPFAVIARSGEDFTAFRFSDLELPLSEYPVQGVPYKSEQPYRAAIYMDRGVYRPGEKAHLVSIVWEEGDQAPDDLPVVGKLRDPRGKLVVSLSGRTNPSGMTEFDIKFDDFATTGKYDFALEIGAAETARHSFYVEEFVPERMKVTASPVDEQILATDTAEFGLSARYLFGALAKGEKYEVECSLVEGEFGLERFPGYSFGVWRSQPFHPMPLGRSGGVLDKEGKTEIECPSVSDITSLKGPGKIKLSVSVFEAGSGRATVARSSLPVHPDRFYLGLKSSSTEAKAGQAVKVEGIVADWYGNLVSELKSVRIEVLEVQSEWIWEYDPDRGRSTWRRYLREMPSREERVKVADGKFEYSFKVPENATGYVVRATSGGMVQTDLYLKGEEYYWWWGDEQESSDKTPRPSLPEGLVMSVPDEIEVNKTAAANFTLPYPGRLLFTVETDEVLLSRWYDVREGPFTAEFVLDKFAPNVYVSGLLVKDPFFESERTFLPGRAFGVRSVKVSPVLHELSLNISAPSEVRPNSDLVVELDAGAIGGPIMATVAAVDEGILQLTDYQNPDPLAEMFRKRGLGVNTFETVGWTLLVPSSSGADSTGGDGEDMEPEGGEAGGRIHAIKPVALWSGIVDLGEDGKATVRFEVPTYRGQLRVVAVAAGPSRIGAASADVLVRDPLVLQATFPRFVSAGDEFVVPVFLTNMTGDKEKVTVELSPKSGVKVKEQAKKDIVLEKDESGTVTFVCRADDSAFGVVEFEVVATGGKSVSRDHARLPLIPNGPVKQEMYFHEISEGELDIAGDLEGWVPQYEKTTVTVMANRYARELGHLKYLIRYPYGCIEQTTSTTRPLLYIGNLVSSLDPEVLKDGSIEEKFMHGIRRLFSMQTSEGGFSYWPGQRENTYWGTAYATHVMLEGLEAGYPVNNDRVEDALAFMERTLTHDPNRIDPKYGYSVAKSEPYMQFVLARAGRGRPGRVKELINNPNSEWAELEDENMFLLKAALYLSGDRTYEKELKKARYDGVDRRTNGWSFWSSLRTRGMMLTVLEGLFPNNKDSELLAQSIAQRLKQESAYYTTQELSWCASGLGKRSASSASQWSQPVLSLDGKMVEPAPMSLAKAAETTWVISGASRAKKLIVTVDSIRDGNLYALVRVEGIKPGEQYFVGDKGLEVRRTYRGPDGKRLEMDQFRLGDLVFVEITMINPTSERIQNIALVDRFAAGFEIENPRLNREHLAGWIDPEVLWEADYVNMRDDRVEIFGGLEAGKKVSAVYVLRAVLGGRFSTPPVRAEVMYEPDKFSQQAGEPVVIKDPWNAVTD